MSISEREVKNKKDQMKMPTYQPGTVYDVNIKYRCDDGTYKTYGKRGFATRADAIAHESEMRTKLRTPTYQLLYMKYRQMALSDYLNEWLDDYAFNYVSPNTYNGYRCNIQKHIIPAIGDVKLSRVTAKIIDDTLRDMLNDDYAAATVKYVYRTLSVAMEHAKKRGYVETNPVRDTFIKFKDTHKIEKSYNLTEMQCLLESKIDSQWKFVIILAGLYGLRRGEVFGLKSNDIDLENRTFYVNQQLCSHNEQMRFGAYTTSLKTESSKRALPITEITYPYFKEQIKLFNEYQPKFDEAYKDLDILVCQDTGKPFIPGHILEYFHDILNKAGIRHIRFDDLRRSAATNMHELTGDFYTIGQILGHSLKGIGILLGISTNMTDITSRYIDVRMSRKLIVLDIYHNKLMTDKMG